MIKTHKEIFLARLLRERDKFELLLNRVGYTRRMTLQGVVGRWSVKDMLAHILAYEQYIADRMSEILHGEEYVPCRTQNALDAFLDDYGYPDFGSALLDEASTSEWITEKYRHVSLDDVVAQEIQAYTSIISFLEKLPEETVNRHHLYDRIANNTYRHYREHTAEIRHWLRSNSAYNRG
jgi:hypothetical protein